MKKVLIPKSNIEDVLIDKKYEDKIEIIPVETLTDVLENALVGPKKDEFIRNLKENKIDRIKNAIPNPDSILNSNPTHTN